ncbi:MAG: hypothetical protein HOP29_12160 [Phycisphaerales bacterium]|nr:hypothetical protein [Phycisphaerales bacterium]
MNDRGYARIGLAMAGVLAMVGSARAGSHSWRISEVFSNADGTVQFIELKECCGNGAENFVAGKTVTSQATGSTFTFPGNLVGSTAGKRILLATTAFAALSGAPTPDYTIAANFIGLNGDTLNYAPANMYDCFTYGMGALPTNGISSINITGTASSCPDAFTTGVNSPTNYVTGIPGSVIAGCIDGDGDGYGSPGDSSCPNGNALDCDDTDDTVFPGATELCDGSIDQDCDGLDDCEEAACCDDDDTCTQEQCGIGGICESTAREYGDANNDGAQDIFDILCVLDGFAGVLNVPCTLTNLDFSPCPGGDGAIDIFDILAVLDGFSGVNGCGCPAGP